jgi:hypothetical protein
MSTIQVEEKVKKELFAVAADLQKRFGKKVSLNDAIDHLIRSFRSEKRDIPLLLSLYGRMGQTSGAQDILRDLRKKEVQHIDRITRKHGA